MKTRPDSMSQFIRTPEQQGTPLQIGPWLISRGMMPGNIWIESPEGEGADIAAGKVAAVIGELFAREF